jgi:hypothetical protein
VTLGHHFEKIGLVLAQSKETALSFKIKGVDVVRCFYARRIRPIGDSGLAFISIDTLSARLSWAWQC